MRGLTAIPVAAQVGDKGFDLPLFPRSLVSRVEIRCDGDLIDSCIAYRQGREGWCAFYKRSSDGRFIIEGDGLVIEERQGCVSVTMKAAAA